MTIITRLILGSLVLLAPLSCAAAERDYQIPFCTSMNGKIEIPVKGGRIDCLTDQYAIEVDYAPKWKESIAQARWYGFQTDKAPAILLIVGPDEWVMSAIWRNIFIGRVCLLKCLR